MGTRTGAPDRLATMALPSLSCSPCLRGSQATQRRHRKRPRTASPPNKTTLSRIAATENTADRALADVAAPAADQHAEVEGIDDGKTDAVADRRPQRQAVIGGGHDPVAEAVGADGGRGPLKAHGEARADAPRGNADDQRVEEVAEGAPPEACVDEARRGARGPLEGVRAHGVAGERR